jgi:hypothetical protein
MAKPGAKTVLFACVLAGAAAACSSILGIQDRSLDNEGRTDGSTADSAADTGQAPVEAGGDTATDGGRLDSSHDAPPEASTCTTPCPLAAGLNVPWAITSDSNNVYWTENGDPGSQNGSVKGCPLSGCAGGPTVYASGQFNPEGIATDGKYVYWGNNTSGGIFACAVTGCSNSPTLVANATSPSGLALDGTYVYWVSDGDDSVNRAVRLAPDGGAAIDMLWDGGGGLQYTPQNVVVDDAAAYVIDDEANLYRVPFDGGFVLLFNSAAAGSASWNLAIDSRGILFGEGTGAILRASPSVAGQNKTIVSMLAAPESFAIDPANGDIYWADVGATGTDGIIGRAHADGSGKTNLATSLVVPDGITLAGSSVYWISIGQLDNMGYPIPNTGTVYRIAK